MELKQKDKSLFKKENWVVPLDSPEMGLCMKKMVFTMKRHEKGFCDVKKEFMTKYDKEYYEKLGVDLTQDLLITMELHHFLRVEDYYHDDSTLRKKFRRGGVGTNPYIESTVECNND